MSNLPPDSNDGASQESTADPAAPESPPEPRSTPEPAEFRPPADQHPVRARLLERARAARRDEAAPELESPPSPLVIPTDTTEPWVQPEPEPAPEPTPASPPAAPTVTSAPSPSSAPPALELPPSAPLPETPAPPPSEVAAELDRIAGHSTIRLDGPRLSPSLTALLGALVGLTVIGTLGIVLGRLHTEPGSEKPAPAASTVEKEAALPVEPEKIERTKVQGPWRIQDDKDKSGLRILKGKIGKEPFLKAIQEAGLPRAEAYRAYTSLKDVRNLDRCASSDQFLALVEQGSKRLKAFEYIVNPEEIYQAREGDDGLLRGQKLDLKIERNQIRRAFVHDGKSFEDSAKRAGFDAGLSSVVEKALAGHMFLSELKSGDRMRVIVQEITVLGEFSRYTGVEAVELLREGKPAQRFYYYSHPQQGGYFDVNGRAPFEGGWRKPITTAPVTSKFNMTRMHPVLKKIMPHNGTDFGAPTGTPIGATAPGVISFIGPAGPSGNLVLVKHPGGYESGYAHLSRYVENLKVGDSVDRMQVVGYCGSTGRSTGPHLHFTMKKDGVFIDPESLNLDGMRVLPPSHRPEFATVREKYDPILDAIELPAIPAQAPPEAPQIDGAQSPSRDPSEDELEGESPLLAEELPAPKPAQAAAAPAPAAPATPAPATPRPGSAIFLSDSDLLRMQTKTDDGEVRE